MPIILPGGEKPKLEAPKAKKLRDPKPKMPVTTLGGLWFAPPAPPKPAKREREKKPKVKNDPKHIAAARELRDRWLERVNADPSLLVSQSKYEVSRIAGVVEAV